MAGREGTRALLVHKETLGGGLREMWGNRGRLWWSLLMMMVF